MKLRELIEELEALEKVAGNKEVVIYAYGGDHGGFVYPGDALLGDALILKDQNMVSLHLPDYDLPNCDVDPEEKDLIVLKFKYSIEVDEIMSGHESFDLSFVASDITDVEEENEKKLPDYLKDSVVYDFNNETSTSILNYLETFWED